MLELKSHDERLVRMFRRLISRSPTEPEMSVLRDAFAQQLKTFRQNPGTASKLVYMGASTPDESLDEAELAAYAMVANLIMNLDEAITKE